MFDRIKASASLSLDGRVRLPLLSVCFAACLLGAAATAQLPAAEARLDQWLRELAEGDLSERRAAALALNDAAPDIPGAVEPLIVALGDQDAQVFHEACSALAKLGPSAGQATDRLIELLADRNRQRAFRAAHALRCVGPSAIEPLRDVLTAGKDRATAAALDALAGMGTGAAPARDAIVGLLGCQDRDIDRRAVTALAACGQAAVPLLVDVLKSPRMPVRRSALDVVVRLSPRPVDLRDDVLPLVDDDNPEVRALAIEAMVLLAPDDPLSARSVLAGIEDEATVVRDTAISVVRYLSSERQNALEPTLIAWVDDAKSAVLSEAAATGLAQMPHHGTAAVGSLLKRWREDPGTDGPYALALQSLGPAGLDPLLAVMQEGSPSEQESVLALIAEMGHTVSAALVERTWDEDAARRRAAVRCLGRVLPANLATVAAVQRLLSVKQPVAVRDAAVTALGNMGAVAQPVVPVLRELRDQVDQRGQQLIDEQLERIEQR